MNPPLIDILYQALNAKIGVVVRTSEPEKLRQKLYAERRKDPDTFANLAIMLSRTSPESEIWVMKK